VHRKPALSILLKLHFLLNHKNAQAKIVSTFQWICHTDTKNLLHTTHFLQEATRGQGGEAKVARFLSSRCPQNWGRPSRTQSLIFSILLISFCFSFCLC